MLDEPTSQLDPKSAEDVLNALVRLNHDLGLTILLAEHRLERVLPYVDRVIYLPDNGGPVLCGEPRQVLGQMELAPPLVQLGKALALGTAAADDQGGAALQPALAPDARNSARRRPAAPPPSRCATAAGRLLEVRGLPVRYGPHDPARGRLAAWPGEIVALMGRNGSGKTTLLKSLVGLVRPKSGNVWWRAQIAGRPVAEICRQVGYLPQDPNTLLFADTVREELGDAAQPRPAAGQAGAIAAGAPVHATPTTCSRGSG